MIFIENEVFVNDDVMNRVIMGMRNPMNSWDKSDSFMCDKYSDCCDCPHYKKSAYCDYNDAFYDIGPNDEKLMKKLVANGPVHSKFLRMIPVWVDITAPLYWWKEFDTYKVGTVSNSCSTMHKIHEKPFGMEDFSHEHLLYRTEKVFASVTVAGDVAYYSPEYFLKMTCDMLNYFRDMYIKTGTKIWWWQMIQLLPSSYNQKRTVMLNYQVLREQYYSRKDHKLDEWRYYCKWIESLPMSDIILQKGEKEDERDNRSSTNGVSDSCGGTGVRSNDC